jgi:hypothetical protein
VDYSGNPAFSRPEKYVSAKVLSAIGIDLFTFDDFIISEGSHFI